MGDLPQLRQRLVSSALVSHYRTARETLDANEDNRDMRRGEAVAVVWRLISASLAGCGGREESNGQV